MCERLGLVARQGSRVKSSDPRDVCLSPSSPTSLLCCPGCVTAFLSFLKYGRGVSPNLPGLEDSLR